MVSLVLAGLIGGELYARHDAQTKVAQAVACELNDQATASFGVTPLLLWQLATNRFTNISVSTAGNQIRDAKGMKIAINIKNVDLDKRTSTSKGTIGSLVPPSTGRVMASNSLCRTQIPVLGPAVISSVITHPGRRHHRAEGHVGQHHRQAGGIRQRVQLQISKFNPLGFTVPKETMQPYAGRVHLNADQELPAGHPRGQRSGHSYRCDQPFSTQNANIPAGNNNDPCFANI